MRYFIQRQWGESGFSDDQMHDIKSTLPLGYDVYVIPMRPAWNPQKESTYMFRSVEQSRWMGERPTEIDPHRKRGPEVMKKQDEPAKRKFTVNMSAELHQQLKVQAVLEKRTMTQILEDALSIYRRRIEHQDEA